MEWKKIFFREDDWVEGGAGGIGSTFCWLLVNKYSKNTSLVVVLVHPHGLMLYIVQYRLKNGVRMSSHMIQAFKHHIDIWKQLPMMTEVFFDQKAKKQAIIWIWSFFCFYTTVAETSRSILELSHAAPNPIRCCCRSFHAGALLFPSAQWGTIVSCRVSQSLTFVSERDKTK